jgi:DsbC/DsbD-like thiol-disulfide interchange protein
MIRILKFRLAATLFALSLFFVCASEVGARPPQSFAASHAKVSLIAEDSAFQAGHSAWIGVLFDLEKGWHVYWVNPGDSGEPPKIQWQLPAGFRAGDIRWPVPVRLGTGTVIDYGYQDRVLLPAPLDVPANYNPAKPVTIAAEVRYLICREVCIPAKAQVTLAVPVAGGTPADAAARREAFRNVRERWPKPLPAGWKVQASDEGKSFVLDVETGSRETKAQFFPIEEDQIDNAAPQTAAPTPRGIRLTLKKSDQLLKPIATLKGVVVLADGAPDQALGREFEISVPVAARRANARL